MKSSIVELNQKEIAAVSGGMSDFLLGVLVGGGSGVVFGSLLTFFCIMERCCCRISRIRPEVPPIQLSGINVNHSLSASNDVTDGSASPSVDQSAYGSRSSRSRTDSC